MIAYELSIAVQKRFGFCPETRFVSGCRPPQQFTSDHAETLSDADVVRIVRNLGGTEAQILEDEAAATFSSGTRRPPRSQA